MNEFKNQPRTATSGQYQGYSAFLAFVIWGSWAFYINDVSEFEGRIISGFTQGTASFIITLIMVALVTRVFNCLPDNRLRLPLSAVITVAITGTGLVLVHRLVETPEIVPTVAPALSVAFVFALFTALKLERKTRPEGHRDAGK